MSAEKNYCILNFKTYDTRKSLSNVNREATREQEYDNVDKTRTHLNEIIEGNMDYLGDYKKALQCDYYQKPDKYGRKHEEPKVKGVGVVMTYSPEAEGTFNESVWIQENVNFLKELFPNCPTNIVVHRDESTLHIQGLIIPTTPEGKINKSYYIHGKKELINIQDRYAERMKQFGLVRGERDKTQNRNNKQSKQVRDLRAKIAHLTEDNTKLRENIKTLSNSLKTAQKALTEAQEIITTQSELLWLKATEPQTFKEIEQELNK